MPFRRDDGWQQRRQAWNPVKVMIVEDEALFRQVLRLQLASYPEVTMVGEASNGREAIELAEQLAARPRNTVGECLGV